MTQEELDAMMNGDVDLDSMGDTDVVTKSVEIKKKPSSSDDGDLTWPPPAPTDDNKMVHQLDDVTRESELKASEIFDIIEKIGDDLMHAEERMGGITAVLAENIEVLTTLHEKFPKIETFKTLLQHNQESLDQTRSEVEMLQNSGDQIMNIMDIMQYQDIHRQKIERVINVMRALSKYMNTLFSSQKDDSERVSSATHIHGDNDTDDVMDNDDIEALLNSFGA